MSRERESDKKFPSELRLDLVSQDWVVIATGRGKRPEDFKTEKKAEEKVSRENCCFCKIETQEPPTLVFAKGKRHDFEGWDKLPKDWTVIVVPNKYPAFFPQPKLEKKTEGGLYQKMNAVGFHEVVVTRDHEKHLGQFSQEEAKELLDVYQARYLDLKKEKFVNHISIFHNHGKKAGASIAHPHSQIITTPLIDVDLKSALTKSSEFYSSEDKKCVYCRMNAWELRHKKRLVYENDTFMAVCPFASKTAFEVIISPKEHFPYFEKITEPQKIDLADMFRTVMQKIYKGLVNPDYNFYLHTAPSDGNKHDYYHWHWTILPKIGGLWAGFEMGTRIEISTIEPEKAAEYLRSQ